MTQKDFVAIAAVLKYEKPVDPQGDTYFTWSAIVHNMAAMCMASNPKFDRRKFFIACDYWS